MTATSQANDFAELTTRPDVHVADERQLVLLMRDWRRGRATRNLRQAISDGYVALFSVVLIGAMVVSVILNAQHAAAGCSSAACTSGRSLLPWAALSGVVAMTLAASRIFGPVLASAAEGFWLMDAPLRRSRLLYRRLALALGAALGAGVVVGALIAALTGSPVRSIVLWAVATGFAAGGATAFAALEQTAERSVPVRIVQTLVALAGVAVLFLVIGTAAGWYNASVKATTAQNIAIGVGAGGLALAVLCGVAARARLGRIRRARLTSGGSLASGMQGAMFALDFGLMRDIIVERDAKARGHVRPTRGRGVGLQAMVWRDVQRLIRFPKPLITLAVSIVVPYAVQALGIGIMNVMLSALVLMAALIPCFTSLRVLARTNGLARCLPYSTSEIRTTASIVPSILTVIWVAAVVPAFVGFGSIKGDAAHGAFEAVVCGLGGLVGAIRWVSAKSPNYGAPMVATAFGALPPGMVINLIRGFDMVALITMPLILGAPAWVSLALGIVCFIILRNGGLDLEQMQEMQEENKRQLAELKAERQGKGTPNQNRSNEKIRVQRKR